MPVRLADGLETQDARRATGFRDDRDGLTHTGKLVSRAGRRLWRTISQQATANATEIDHEDGVDGLEHAVARVRSRQMFQMRVTHT